MENKKRKLFLSYGHDKYSDLVLKVKTLLEKQNFTVFIDSEQLHSGDDWEIKLENAIKSSDKIIFFITPYSARRPDGYCLNELAMALFYKKDILPVMLKFCIPPLSIARKQFLNFEDFTKESSFDIKRLEEKVDYLTKIIENKLDLKFEGEEAKLYHDLNPIDFTQDLAKHKKIIGREWINDEIEKWLNNHLNSRIFWLVAEAGYGKSTIATYLSNNFPNVIGIHFCSFKYPSKNDPKNVIKSLAFYLSSQIPEVKDEILNIHEIEKIITSNELFEKLILNPLQKLENQNQNYIFIIDALDEAIEDNRFPLAELIRDEFYKLPINIKIIITSRYDNRLKQIFSNLNPYILETNDEKNILDCKKYIIDFLSKNRYADLIDNYEWMQKLLEKSQANMLYLTRYFKDVKNDFFDIYDIDNFPNSLNGLYAEFFNRNINDENDYYTNYAPIFEILITSNKAISLDLIYDILSINKIQLKRRLNKFSSLLKFENDKITFFHKSISDWLLLDDNAYFQIDIKSSYQRIYEYTKDLDLNEIPLDLLELFSKAVVYLNKQSEKYKKYFVDIMEQAKDNFGMFYFYILYFHQTQEGKNMYLKIKNYYYLYSNYKKLIKLIDNSNKYVTILANCSTLFPEQQWDYQRRQALRNMFNPLALALIVDDPKIYEYIKNNATVVKELSLWRYIEDILWGTSTQNCADEIYTAINEKIVGLSSK